MIVRSNEGKEMKSISVTAQDGKEYEARSNWAEEVSWTSSTRNVAISVPLPARSVDWTTETFVEELRKWEAELGYRRENG